MNVSDAMVSQTAGHVFSHIIKSVFGVVTSILKDEIG